MASSDVDRAMRAVARARAVRERDARIGLATANAEAQAHQQRVTQLNTLLVDSGPVGSGTASTSATQFRARGEAFGHVTSSLQTAQESASAAERIVDVAQAHWSADKVRLRVVESLLERRAEARKAEQERREVVALDDIAAQGWLRRREATSPD